MQLSKDLNKVSLRDIPWKEWPILIHRTAHPILNMFLLKISHDQNVTAEHFEGGEHFELSATHEKLKLPKGVKGVKQRRKGRRRGEILRSFPRGCLLGYNPRESPQKKLKLTAEKKKKREGKEKNQSQGESREERGEMIYKHVSQCVSDEMIPMDMATITDWRGDTFLQEQKYQQKFLFYWPI